MAGCSFSNTRGNAAFVGFYRPTLISPLQVANFARCMNPGEINYDKGASLRVAAVSSTIFGAGLGLSVRYGDFMKNAVSRRFFRSRSRRVLHDRLELLHNPTMPSGLAGIWLDYPPGYIPPKVDYYVDDGSFCFLSSPFTVSCSPLSGHNADAISAGNEELHTPTITTGSRSLSVTATAAAAVSPSDLASSSGNSFTSSCVNGTVKQARHFRSSCRVPVTMKTSKDRVPSAFLNLFDHSVAFASIVSCVFVVTIALVLRIALHTMALVVKGRVRRGGIYGLVMTLRGLQFPSLQKEPAGPPAFEVSAVEDGNPSPLVETTAEDAISNSPTFDTANDIVEIVQDNTHSFMNSSISMSFTTFKQNVSGSNIPSSSVVAPASFGGVLTAKKAFDDAIEAHIRSVEARALAAMEDEDDIDKHIRAVEARALLQMASLDPVALAFVPESLDPVCKDAAPKKTHRRRRRRIRRPRNKNHVAAVDTDSDAHAAEAAYTDSDESDDSEPASESSFSDYKEPDTSTSSAPIEDVDEPIPEQHRKKKRRQRGRNRGRGPRNQQVLFEPDEDDPYWAPL